MSLIETVLRKAEGLKTSLAETEWKCIMIFEVNKFIRQRDTNHTGMKSRIFQRPIYLKDSLI